MTGRARVVRLCVGAFAVCISALVAHGAIDVLGDFFLARDAYDFLPHQSRAAAAVVALLVFAAAALRIIIATLDAAGGDGESPSALLRRAIPRHRAGFAAAIALLAIPTLAGMEALDVVAAGRTVDDIADLLAGAPLFSIGILTFIAVAVALFIYEAITRLIASMNAIVGAVAAFLARRSPSPAALARGVDCGICGAGTKNILAWRGGLRAPPRFLRVLLIATSP